MALIQPVVDGKIPKDTSTTSKSDTSNDLGYDQFLQLLCAEMQYQDPLEPTSNTGVCCTACYIFTDGSNTWYAEYNREQQCKCTCWKICYYQDNIFDWRNNSNRGIC